MARTSELPEMVGEFIDLSKQYVREQTLAGDEPNERGIMKVMGKLWGEKVSSKDMYEMFPGMPSKQGLKIGGCPQSTRKGGY